MAVIAVAAAGAALNAAYPASAVLIAAATAAAAIGASYIDQRYIYPKLFGRDDPRQQNTTGIDAMTGDDGSPGHRSWGSLALVGGHALFFEQLAEELVSAGGSKKGAGVSSFERRTATVGIGWTRNLIASIEQINADQKVFWRREPNNVVWSDYRATITTASSGTRMRITLTAIGETQELQPLFALGDVVRITRMLGGAVNGLWRVVDVQAGAIEFTPLDGQTPAAGTAGTDSVPMEIRRIDALIADHLAFWDTTVVGGFMEVKVILDGVGTFPGGSSPSHYWRSPVDVLPPGTVLRLSRFSNTALNGRWIVVSWQKNPFYGATDNRWLLRINPLDGQTFGSSPGTPGTEFLPALLEMDSEEGFIEPVPNQTLQHYLGTETQGPDADLVAVYGAGNVHGYRGLARTTMRQLNLTNWGDRVPQFSGIAKTSDGQTTRDLIRDLMREAFRGDDTRYDLSRLSPNRLLGYTRRGRQSTTTTMQPVAIAYGIEAQEQGDVWVFFKGQDADLHQLAETELGAYVGRNAKSPGKFQHQRLQDADLPRRLSLYYRDPLNSFARSEKTVRAARPQDETDEGVAVDVDPIVLYPWDAANANNRLYNNALVARDQGKIQIPPSRRDMLPNDRVTFTALNWNEEDVTLDGGAIDHTTQIGDVEPFSISIEVDFETEGRCRLVDNGDGELIGFPAGVTPSTNAVDYATGAIEFAADDDILEARIRYEFPNPWRMRVQRIVRRVNRVTECDLVAVAESFPVIGSPVQYNEPAIAQVVHPAQLQTEILDIPAPNIFSQDHAGMHYAAAPMPGSTWRGAGVYSSDDGVSYTFRGAIAKPSVMGHTTDALPTGQANVPDWESEVTISLTYGTLEDASLEQISSGFGTNWALIGDEIVAFQQAELNEDGTYTLRGLLRGLRDTDDAMATHAAGDRFVLLTSIGLGSFMPDGSGLFEQFSTPGDIGSTLYVKIVPVGGLLDDYEAVQVTFRANNVRPFAPAHVTQGNFNLATYSWNTLHTSYDPAAWLAEDVVVHWFRRSRALIPVFGAGSSAPLMEAIERYEVEVLRNDVVLTNRTTIIGGANTGSPMAHRLFRYKLAEQIADGFTSGDDATIRVRQIGAGGTNGYSRPAELTWVVP